MAIRFKVNMKAEGEKVRMVWSLNNTETGETIPVGDYLASDIVEAIAVRELINNLGSMETKVKTIQGNVEKWFNNQVETLKRKLTENKTKTTKKTKTQLTEEEVKKAKLQLFESLKKELEVN